MRNSTAILATVALGAVLATGSATASMAGAWRRSWRRRCPIHHAPWRRLRWRGFGGRPFAMNHGGDRGSVAASAAVRSP